jgi:hypothetical protein
MKRSLLVPGLLTSIFFFSGNSTAQSITKVNSALEKSFASSINTPVNCDAYPYLSDDGLRLYFTSDRTGGFGRVYYCSRNSVNGSFDEPKPLSKNLVDGFYAATFTADELTIYASKDGEIYTAKRNSLNDEFKKPVIVNGLAEGSKFAPSISPDGSELIVFIDISEGDVGVHYRKNEAGNFIEVNRMKGLGETELDPGQFSKDGLSFYASCGLKNGTKKQDVGSDRKVEQKIIRFIRKALTENFIIVEEVPAELNLEMRNHQPTMNKDETIFVVVSSETDSWGQNELRLVNLQKENSIEDSIVKVSNDTAIICYIDTTVIFDSIRHLYKYYEYYVFKDEIVCAMDTIFCAFGEDQMIMLDPVAELATGKPSAVTEFIPQAKVYPNPFTENIVVTLDKNDINSNFELFDIGGKKILTSRLSNVISRIQFNKPGAGIYVYRITNNIGNVVASGKLVRR